MDIGTVLLKMYLCIQVGVNCICFLLVINRNVSTQNASLCKKLEPGHYICRCISVSLSLQHLPLKCLTLQLISLHSSLFPFTLHLISLFSLSSHSPLNLLSLSTQFPSLSAQFPSLSTYLPLLTLPPTLPSLSLLHSPFPSFKCLRYLRLE